MLAALVNFCILTISIGILPSNQISLKSEIIRDFGGNEYVLTEGNNTYEILDSNGVFIEGSKKTNSPYFPYDGLLNNSNNLLFNLPTNRNEQSVFSFIFPSGTIFIRFIAHKDTPNTNKNKGRISIGEMKFTTYNQDTKFF